LQSAKIGIEQESSTDAKTVVVLGWYGFNEETKYFHDLKGSPHRLLVEKEKTGNTLWRNWISWPGDQS
jgi:hypothetical protein